MLWIAVLFSAGSMLLTIARTSRPRTNPHRRFSDADFSQCALECIQVAYFVYSGCPAQAGGGTAVDIECLCKDSTARSEATTCMLVNDCSQQDITQYQAACNGDPLKIPTAITSILATQSSAEPSLGTVVVHSTTQPTSPPPVTASAEDVDNSSSQPTPAKTTELPSASAQFPDSLTGSPVASPMAPDTSAETTSASAEPDTSTSLLATSGTSIVSTPGSGVTSSDESASTATGHTSSLDTSVIPHSTYSTTRPTVSSPSQTVAPTHGPPAKVIVSLSAALAILFVIATIIVAFCLFVRRRRRRRLDEAAGCPPLLRSSMAVNRDALPCKETGSLIEPVARTRDSIDDQPLVVSRSGGERPPVPNRQLETSILPRSAATIPPCSLSPSPAFNSVSGEPVRILVPHEDQAFFGSHPRLDQDPGVAHPAPRHEPYEEGTSPAASPVPAGVRLSALEQQTSPSGIAETVASRGCAESRLGKDAVHDHQEQGHNSTAGNTLSGAIPSSQDSDVMTHGLGVRVSMQGSRPRFMAVLVEVPQDGETEEELPPYRPRE